MKKNIRIVLWAFLLTLPLGSWAQGGRLSPEDSLRLTHLAKRWNDVKDLAPGERNGGVVSTTGSFLTPLQVRDSVLIGDQMWFGVSLKDVKSGTVVGLPELDQKNFIEGFDLLCPDWVVDTLRTTKLGKKGRDGSVSDIDFKVLMTTFEEGDYVLPRLSVQRIDPGSKDIDTLLFDALDLSVKTFPIDTTTYVPHDIKGQVRYPLTLSEVLPWVALAWILIVLGIAIGCIIIIRRNRGEVVFAPKEPAHITALRSLDALRGNKYWAPEKQKYFYTGVTDALRKYMVSRYGISAMEMTTAEIFSALSSEDIPSELRGELKELFERSDFVKFAKYTASDEENAHAVPLGVRFVTSTYEALVKEEEEQGNASSGEENNNEQEGRAPVETPREDDSAYMPK